MQCPRCKRNLTKAAIVCPHCEYVIGFFEEEASSNRDKKQERFQGEETNRNHTHSDSRLDEKKYAKVLGLKGQVEKSDIKRAYRELVAKYHPDKVNHLGEEFQQLASEKTREIIAAYEYFRIKYNIT